MQIVFLSTAIIPRVGGPFESMAGLARGLAAANDTDVTVVACTSKCEDWETHRSRFGKATLSVHAGPLHERVASARRYLRKRLSQGTVDIVHASGLWDGSSILVDLVQGMSKTPVVWSMRGMLEPWALQHHKRRKWLAWLAFQRAAVSRADVIHATAEAEAVSCRQMGLCQPIAIIPNGIDVTQLPAAAASRHRSGPRRCVYLGRLHPKKGLVNLIEAWTRCDTSGWELEIAGPDSDGHSAMLESLVRRHGLANVRVSGPRYWEDRRRFLEDCELFICPSFSENFGNAIAEAMERGKPVITTTGTPWGVLAEKDLGWWVRPAVKDLSLALESAMSRSPERLHEMGMRCHEHVEQTMSWASVVARTQSVYQWLLGGNRPSCIQTRRTLLNAGEIA